MAEKTTVGGLPIECLTGEPAVIWSGWRLLGDKELVREASAKGTHIDLAYKCLAYRRSTCIEDAYQYFAQEVELWIMELLQKHQVHRASHILKNVGKNSVEYIFDVCIKSKDSSLRNYLSEYMINENRFEHEHKTSWNIIKTIIEFEQKYMLQNHLSSTVCIEDIIRLPERVRQALCIELYFSMTKEQIPRSVSNSIVWEFLLSNNKIEFIQYWIDMYYNGNPSRDVENLPESYKTMFASLEISADMIESIDSSHASDLVKDLTKNCLCRYGVFGQKELQNTKLLLSRIFNCGITLKQFDKILSLNSCLVPKSEFSKNIDEELCLAYCLSETLTEEKKLKLKTLYKVLGSMCDAEKNIKDAVVRGIFESLDYITNDVEKFLKESYLTVLSLVFLYLSSNNDENGSEERNDLRRVFTNKTGFKINNYHISSEILQHTLKETPILQYIINENKKEDDATMYDLIHGYRDLDVKRLYKWRFENQSMPTFSAENLVKKYGYSESLTYGYYLKESRPNMALYNLLHMHGKVLGNVSSQRKSKAALYAHILTLKALDKHDIICSSISFIEMLGISSENLRLHVTAAKYVQEQLHISIGHYLEGIIYRNESDLKIVLSYLESSFKTQFKDINFAENCEEFAVAIKTWDMIIRFAKAHNSPLPETLPLYLAEQNHWFEFILICDLCAYPLNQVTKCAKAFENPLLREHIQTCLESPEVIKSHSVHAAEQKTKFRDSKQSTYYQIGHKQSGSPVMDSSVTSPTRNNGDAQTVTLVDSSPTNDSNCSEEDDLWMTILKCHQSPDPPRALISAARQTCRPILTILATCYEPSSTAAYCYSWIVIVTANEAIQSTFKDCLDYQIWSARKVSDLLEQMVLNGFTGTLNKAFKIFLPDNCLSSFFEFLTQCVDYGDFKSCQKSLLNFKSQCSNLKCNKIMDWDCIDVTNLKNLYWITMVAVKCSVITLGYCLRSTHLQTKFLEVLTRCNFGQDLPAEVPDFRCLLQLTKILQNTNVTFNFKAYTLRENKYDFSKEIQRCINDLLLQENYNSALEIVSAANFNPEEIILTQCRSEFKRAMEKDGRVESEFWKDCASHFAKYNIPNEKTAEFLVEHAEKVASHRERYEILKLAFETIKNENTDKRTVDTLEMAMWKSCILAGPENIPFDNGNYVFNKLKTELLSGLSALQISCTLTDESEANATEILINRLIDIGRLEIALRISTIFNFQHKDLQILMLCLTLAEGQILPSELSLEQRSLFEETNKPKQQKFAGLKNRRLRRLSSSSSLASCTLTPSGTSDILKARDESLYKIQQECLSTLEKLRESLKHGTEICSRILLCYKLAVKLDQTYQLLLRLNNPIQFLQETIENNIENKLEIATDIITAYKISCENVAIFLTDNIVDVIRNAVEEGSEDAITLWGYPLNTNFHMIMELCSDVSVLGWQLSKTVNKLLGHSHGANRNVATLKTIVELLVRSHDCFTTACNMEGIASILRKCQNLANILQTLKHWTLLVRLLTGVGRFTEMNYVFQILKENDQFEFLLGKGVDKTTGLKIALLEYLKRQCPENKELFTLVALHFRLYHEIAMMWESEAKDAINSLVSNARKDRDKLQSGGTEIKLVKNDHVHKQLQLAVTNYTHATQYYLQDNKLNLAGKCSDQAQLVALQLSLFETVSTNQQVICIVNLKSDEIDRILCSLLNFSQALVVIRAYNHHVDWTNLVYSHSILNGETKYLKDFVSAMKLTPHLVQDCARRYRLEKSITHKMTDNMKLLISELSDVGCKYAMASQLGFKDIVETMLNDPMIGAYLKDTIWKKGYNSNL